MRLAQGTVELHHEALDLRTVVEDVIGGFVAEASARDVSLDLEVAADPVWMFADRARLQQVMSNLTTNAVRHSNDGGRVTIRCEVRDETVHLAVADQGRGIASEFLSRIFEPFVQVQPVMQHRGLGLGLSVVRTIVALHGGTVVARSDGPGTGAEFVVTLPRGGPTGQHQLLFAREMRVFAERVREQATEACAKANVVRQDARRVKRSSHVRSRPRG